MSRDPRWAVGKVYKEEVKPKMAKKPAPASKKSMPMSKKEMPMSKKGMDKKCK